MDEIGAGVWVGGLGSELGGEGLGEGGGEAGGSVGADNAAGGWGGLVGGEGPGDARMGWGGGLRGSGDGHGDVAGAVVVLAGGWGAGLNGALGAEDVCGRGGAFLETKEALQPQLTGNHPGPGTTQTLLPTVSMISMRVLGLSGWKNLSSQPFVFSSPG